MSRVLPNAMVVQAFNNLGLPQERLPDDLDEIMNQGLQKLYGFQHDNGAWGWWYDDDSSLYQTAFVIYGLVMTGQAGYAVDEGVLTRGITATKSMLTQADDPRTQAYALYVLSTAGHGDLASEQDLLADKDQLDYFAQAALALALFQDGDSGGANELVDDLVAAAVQTSSTAHWPQSDEDGSYNRKAMASTTRATALVLEALVQVRPASPLLQKSALWLMNERSGSHWRTTQETSYAILALADYVQVSDELAPDYDFELYLNASLLYSGSIGTANALELLPEITLPLDALQDGTNHVRIVKNGTGKLYYALTLRVSHLSDGFVAVQPSGSGISVTRSYQLAAGADATPGTLADFEVGDLIKVHLSIEASDDAWYVIIDDPLPAGCEALNERLNTTSHAAGGDQVPWYVYGYNRKDVHDERVTLFVTFLWPGRHEYDYLIRATTPGEFSVLPTDVYLMYEPQTWARSASQRLRIGQVRAPFRLAGDLDRNCRVDDFDLEQVLAPWNTRAGERGYYATSDLDKNGVVDVVDVARVAANWGQVCSLDLSSLATWADWVPPLRLEPAALDVSSGQQYTLTVRLDEARALGEGLTLNGYQFRLDFDPALLRVDDVAIRPEYEALGPHVDAASGQATSGAFRYGAGAELEQGASLPQGHWDDVAVFTFSALGDGHADFNLSDVQAVLTGPPFRFYLPLVLSELGDHNE